MRKHRRTVRFMTWTMAISSGAKPSTREMREMADSPKPMGFPFNVRQPLTRSIQSTAPNLPVSQMARRILPMLS